MSNMWRCRMAQGKLNVKLVLFLPDHVELHVTGVHLGKFTMHKIPNVRVFKVVTFLTCNALEKKRAVLLVLMLQEIVKDKT